MYANLCLIKVSRYEYKHTNLSCSEIPSDSFPDQQHIQYEVCEEHGMFMDAGEFADFKNETLVESFMKVINKAKGKLSL